MQCPVCNRTYNSGKFCTSCERPDGGAVRLVEGTRQVDPNDLDEYIKMLDVFLSDGFLSADEKATLEDLRRQFGISDVVHQSILKENGYKYRETMPVRIVLNRKTIQGYGAGQPCLAKVRFVNTDRRPLQRVEIRYWLNSEAVHTSTIRQLMPNKVHEVDLDFRPSESGQYALKMELTVDPFVGDQTEYVVESTSFQVYSQSQLQSVHIHQSGENIVGNHKVHGTDMPKAMLLGDGQWDELTLSPKQRAVEWGEWTSQRLFAKINESIQSASQQYGMTSEFQGFVKGLSLERKENEDFITWEERLKVVQRGLNEVTSNVSARLESERKQKEAEERRQREAEEKRQRELKVEQERKAREEAERKRKEEEEQRRLTKEGDALYQQIETLLENASSEVKQELNFKTLSTTCKNLRQPTGRQTLQTWVKKLTQTKSDLPKQLSDIAEARKKRLEAERRAKEAEEKRKREEDARKERERQAKLEREKQERIEAEQRRQREEQERKEREARAKAKREKEQRERQAREEAERQRLEEERQKQVEIQRKKQAIIDEGKRQLSVSREEIIVKGEYGGFLGFGKQTTEYPMVKIPAGWFMMGALENDEDAYNNEKPRHKVTLTRDFLMGKYPVTQALWESVMGSNPSHFKGASRPVEQVSWLDVVAFCNKLSEREGLERAYSINGENVTCNWSAKGYRLPTEAEWEYSARSGQRFKLAGSNNVDEVAWYRDNSDKETHPVGLKRPNGFGLYDMSGNVYEWVWDVKGYYSSSGQTDPTGPDSGPHRVYRGGCCVIGARYSRVSLRDDSGPARRVRSLGFRLSRFVQ